MPVGPEDGRSYAGRFHRALSHGEVVPAAPDVFVQRARLTGVGENSYATRGAPILSSRVTRDFGAKDHLSWEHLSVIRRKWKRKLVVKGIMNPIDAQTARDIGADGIIVSNHGGRQLDGVVSPLRVLPEIVSSVGPDFPVMMDGGIRRGTDVLKALALGARLVFVGRPIVYAAAVAGEAGVRHALQILADEVQRDLGLLGLTSVRELGPAQLRAVSPRPLA